MITVSDLSINFGGQNLFKHVNLKFVSGNCYGVIGANGAGKSTLLRILSGDLEPTTGEVIIDPRTRMSVLKQDHYAYDEYTVLDTIIQGNPRLYEIMQQKDALYAKEDFSDEDGALAAELEGEFAEMNGWEAETEAGQILQGLGIPTERLYDQMSALADKEKVKILLARALFGHPDIILLDEPTKGIDSFFKEIFASILTELKRKGITVVMVSHDVEFCARYADQVSMFFDGQVLTTDTPRRFFGANSFYTTAANRMSRHVFRNAVTAEDVIDLYKQNRGIKV